ncbi:helix-turn-helix transcriptional regulator [Skermania sp. ID1734]|nr:helix-turn-helix transcriptional regulator [Skermania sp. ID1734]
MWSCLGHCSPVPLLGWIWSVRPSARPSGGRLELLDRTLPEVYIKPVQQTGTVLVLRLGCGKVSGHEVRHMTRRITRGFRVDRLVAARKDKGFTQAELARLAGLTTGAVKSWESGRTTPEVANLARILDALGLHIADVIDIPVGDRHLGDLRVLALLPQTELARRIGISTTALGELERGEANLSDTVAARLADALGVAESEVREAFVRTRTRPPNTPA